VYQVLLFNIYIIYPLILENISAMLSQALFSVDGILSLYFQLQEECVRK